MDWNLATTFLLSTVRKAKILQMLCYLLTYLLFPCHDQASLINTSFFKRLISATFIEVGSSEIDIWLFFRSFLLRIILFLTSLLWNRTMMDSIFEPAESVVDFREQNGCATAISAEVTSGSESAVVIHEATDSDMLASLGSLRPRIRIRRKSDIENEGKANRTKTLEKTNCNKNIWIIRGGK